MGIFYATREQVARSLDVLQAAYAGSLIDAKIDAQSRMIEGFLHRRFYPELRTVLRDWPNNSSSPSWEISLGDQELISVLAVTSGGTNITSDVILTRGDDLNEPPYSAMQIDLSSSASFSAGASWQQSLSIQGLYGYNDTSTVLGGGALGAGINSSVSTIVINPLSGNFTIGIGSLILVDTERMVIVDRRMSSTAEVIGADLAAVQSAKLIVCTGAANLAVDEIILVDGERMRIDDIAGTNLIVTRAYDGSTLAAHTSAAPIYALRTCLVQRGALGSSSASHSNAAPIYVHAYPAGITELCVAETAVSLIGIGDEGVKAAKGIGLDDIRDRAWRTYGRKGRSAAV